MDTSGKIENAFNSTKSAQTDLQDNVIRTNTSDRPGDVERATVQPSASQEKPTNQAQVEAAYQQWRNRATTAIRTLLDNTNGRNRRYAHAGATAARPVTDEQIQQTMKVITREMNL